MDKDFYKRFEQMLNDIFGEKSKPSTPFETFFENMKNDEVDFSKFRNSVRRTKDGIVTTFYYIINPDGSWSAPEKNTKRDLKTKLEECVKNQDFEQAAKLRDEIRDLEKNGVRINQLKKELDIAILAQNFERAIEIRDELKKIN